ncbi:hypothetical protein NEHOM01_2303 [Nematocida homosporus]|uniref:uncharacterized protein n=1 Tax=Nematocida homosporus TaxID=1912981 RepID=UPI0022206101|nr:uncharacterized protein NEHOM01_2303 [Nematocida homosporus]KAI5187601.1 hypothetical protein NEHOM01_2303 [Nematocida homosporus]
MDADMSELPPNPPPQRLFSLEEARDLDIEFLDRAKHIQDEMKQLKKDLDMHKKKKKALELCVDKLRLSFQEYVYSIEVLENSPLYKKVAPNDKLNHSRILKNCHLFMPPVIDSDSYIDAPIENTIRKACLEYKHVKSLYNACLALENTKAPSTETTADIEHSFDIYEKGVNYSHSKMSFALLVNQLVLQLMEGIFQEVEHMHGLSFEYFKLCLNLHKIKEYQYNSSENAIDPHLISRENKTFTDKALEELERQKRRISNEKRPTPANYKLEPNPVSLQRRRVPYITDFLVGKLPVKSTYSFTTKFEISQQLLRGHISIYPALIVVEELVFGWKFIFQKEKIFYFKAASNYVELETAVGSITIYCNQKESLFFSKWMQGADFYFPQDTPLGYVDADLDTAFCWIFEENTDIPPELYHAHKYTLIETKRGENNLRKRLFTKKLIWWSFEFSTKYEETYLLEKRTPQEIVVLIYSEYSLCSFLPPFAGISKITLQLLSNEQKETTNVFYAYKKSTSWAFKFLSRMLIKENVCTLHSIAITSKNGHTFHKPRHYFTLLATSFLMALLSVAIATGYLYKLLFKLLLL